MTCISAFKHASLEIKDALELLDELTLRIEEIAAHLFQLQLLHFRAAIPNVIAIIVGGDINGVAINAATFRVEANQDGAISEFKIFRFHRVVFVGFAERQRSATRVLGAGHAKAWNVTSIRVGCSAWFGF